MTTPTPKHLSLAICDALWGACLGHSNAWLNPVVTNPEEVANKVFEAMLQGDETVDEVEALVTECFEACTEDCARNTDRKTYVVDPDAQNRQKMTFGLVYVMTLVRQKFYRAPVIEPHMTTTEFVDLVCQFINIGDEFTRDQIKTLHDDMLSDKSLPPEECLTTEFADRVAEKLGDLLRIQILGERLKDPAYIVTDEDAELLDSMEPKVAMRDDFTHRVIMSVFGDEGIEGNN